MHTLAVRLLLVWLTVQVAAAGDSTPKRERDRYLKPIPVDGGTTKMIIEAIRHYLPVTRVRAERLNLKEITISWRSLGRLTWKSWMNGRGEFVRSVRAMWASAEENTNGLESICLYYGLGMVRISCALATLLTGCDSARGGWWILLLRTSGTNCGLGSGCLMFSWTLRTESSGLAA